MGGGDDSARVYHMTRPSLEFMKSRILIEDPGSRIEDRGSRSRIEDQGPRSRIEIEDVRLREQDRGNEIEASG